MKITTVLYNLLQDLLPHPSMGEISLSAASTYVLPSKCETKFHTNTKQREKL